MIRSPSVLGLGLWRGLHVRSASEKKVLPNVTTQSINDSFHISSRPKAVGWLACVALM